jgi:cytochrome c oxidase subunit II
MTKRAGGENMQISRIAIVGLGLCHLPACTMQAQLAGRTIEVHARRFAFEPSEISVKAGETVRLRLVSDDVPHSLLVKQLNLDIAATKSNPGDAIFKSDAPGEYSGRCGRFCGSGHGRMIFIVHVNRN